MSDISNRLKTLIDDQDRSYGDLANETHIPKSAIQRYATGATEKIPIDRVIVLAKALKTSPEFILGWDNKTDSLPGNILPMPKMRKIPLLGTIACGEPILAAENLDGEVDIPAEIHADFALRCKGDSMINARIFDGDLVYIKRCDIVDNGEIAAVIVENMENEATLKRVHLYNDHISLEPENPQYRPLVFWETDMNRVRIIGKAVAFTSAVR